MYNNFGQHAWHTRKALAESGKWILTNATQVNVEIKADMKSYIPLETAAIFVLANLFIKQGISSEYVMVDFICSRIQVLLCYL